MSEQLELRGLSVAPSQIWRGVRLVPIPRVESVTPGEWIEDLEHALRVFEILEGQVGVLIFVADALAAAFVVPHPNDYRRLHRTLLGDCYGELIYRHSCMFNELPKMASPIPAERVSSIADLERELARMRANWAEFLHGMAGGLFRQSVNLEQVYRLGRHKLYRFLPEFSVDDENHIGELIRTPTGEVAYLKTFRLSAAQVRRGYLLSTLARHDWNLEAAAQAMNVSPTDLRLRLHRAGFERLLRP
jgi:hypothetical protein